jgi:hypothetical protein
MAGGTVWSVAQMAAVKAVASRHGIPVHLDGARIFNAAVALGVPAKEIAAQTDSATFCLSKGLSARRLHHRGHQDLHRTDKKWQMLAGRPARVIAAGPGGDEDDGEPAGGRSWLARRLAEAELSASP